MDKLIRFVSDYVSYVVRGGPKFHAWMASLGVLIVIWAYGNYVQATEGLAITGLTDQVSDGLYLGNFVFLVGVAAAAVTVVFPAYVYRHKALHDVTVLGEMVAITAVIMCILFVISHMGRPDRLWHMIPLVGIFNFPNSMLAFDTLVLVVYLLLNLVGGFYFLYTKYTGSRMNHSWYLPLVYVSIVWALSIHTVTAFLINTLPARPHWHHTMMPIQFISTAFAAGPALIILLFLTIRRNTKLSIADEAIDMLSTIATYCLGIALFLLMSEVVTELYATTEHSRGLQYLMFGAHGLSTLTAVFWASLAAMTGAFVMLLIPGVRKKYRLLPVACALAFGGIWVQKGVGLLVPGYIPSPIGEFTNYVPTTLEVLVTLGNWAIGFFILTILAKGAVGVLLEEVKYASDPWKLTRELAPYYADNVKPIRMQPWASLSERGEAVQAAGEAGPASRARRRGRAAFG